ncbi:MAG TPA: aldo/keto reductase [Chitinophagales bacterium]|nr:aldo/keto reductase [Chitinophagales bacterium]
MIDKLILGTVQFGVDYGINNSIGKPSLNQTYDILSKAKEKGINTLDTADAYGNATEVIGGYLKEHPNSFSINTKFNHLNTPLRDQVIKSLEQLNCTVIENFFFHNFNLYKTYPNTIDELSRLKEEKLIKNIGISVYENSEFEEAINNDIIDVIQLPYNLLDNSNQRGELMALAKKKNKSLQIRSVFLQGLFFMNLENINGKLSKLNPYLLKLHEISKRFKIPMEHLALQYATQQNLIDNVIIGIDSEDQLNNNILALNTILSEEVIEEINKINVREVELLYPKNWK